MLLDLFRKEFIFEWIINLLPLCCRKVFKARLQSFILLLLDEKLNSSKPESLSGNGQLTVFEISL